MGRRLDDRKIIQRLLKGGVKLSREHPSEARQARLKQLVLMIEAKYSEATGAEDFSRCMRFLQEAAASDALGHNEPPGYIR